MISRDIDEHKIQNIHTSKNRCYIHDAISCSALNDGDDFLDEQDIDKSVSTDNYPHKKRQKQYFFIHKNGLEKSPHFVGIHIVKKQSCEILKKKHEK